MRKLRTAALMIAGWDGCTEPFPGFPKNRDPMLEVNAYLTTLRDSRDAKMSNRRWRSRTVAMCFRRVAS